MLVAQITKLGSKLMFRQYFCPVVQYANDLILLFMNINENIRKNQEAYLQKIVISQLLIALE